MSTTRNTLSELTRGQIVQKMRENLAEVEDHFATAKHWNENVRRSDETPIDADPGGQLNKIREWLRVSLEREDSREFRLLDDGEFIRDGDERRTSEGWEPVFPQSIGARNQGRQVIRRRNAPQPNLS